MKKLALILSFFGFCLLGLFGQDLPPDAISVNPESPQVVYNGPSDQLLLAGLGFGTILDFTYDSNDEPFDFNFDIYVDGLVNYRIQIEDLIAFDATLDYHVNLVSDSDGSLGVGFENKIGLTPLLITHLYHKTRTRKFMSPNSFSVFPIFWYLPPLDPQSRSVYDVETLDTVSFRAGTNLFLGLNGIGVDASQSLILGLEFRSLAQASFIPSSGKTIVIQDFFTVNVDGIINYPTDKAFNILECLGLNIGAAWTMGGLVGGLNLGISSFAPGTQGLIEHIFRYSTTLSVPIRL